MSEPMSLWQILIWGLAVGLCMILYYWVRWQR